MIKKRLISTIIKLLNKDQWNYDELEQVELYFYWDKPILDNKSIKQLMTIKQVLNKGVE